MTVQTMKMMNIVSSTAPPRRLPPQAQKSRGTMIPEPRRSGKSFLRRDGSTFIGTITALIPRIINMLRRFEPRRFPTVIPASSGLEIAPEMLTAASGALVPIATMVSPMIRSGTRSRRAI